MAHPVEIARETVQCSDCGADIIVPKKVLEAFRERSGDQKRPFYCRECHVKHVMHSKRG